MELELVVSFNDKDPFAKVFHDHVTEKDGSLCFVRSRSTDPNYSKILELARTYDTFIHVVKKTFTTKEILKADYCAISPRWVLGYPSPIEIDRNRSFISLNEYRCCHQVNQKGPIVISKHPSWGKRCAFKLETLYEYIFLRKDVYETIFKEYANGCIVNKGNYTLDNCIQLLPRITDAAISTIEHEEKQTCRYCHYQIINDEYSLGYRISKLEEGNDVIMSREYFGPVDNSNRITLVSRKIVTDLLSMKANIDYIPCYYDPR